MSNRRVVTIAVVTTITGGGMLTAVLAQDRSAGSDPATAGITAASEKFVADFNRGDAQAVAAHWTEDGDYVNENGQKYHGRQTIEQEYRQFFTTNPGLKMALEIESIRTVDANNAIEDGFATLSPLPAGIPTRSRYTAMHTKRDGQWQMTAVRDSRVDNPAARGRLEDLEFLVGTWAVEQDGAKFETTCRWINDKHLLERTYTASNGDERSEGRQLIGWDPLAGQIVSWTFTNEGGFAAGAWAPSEEGWVVATVGVLMDGTLTSSTDVWSNPDGGTLTWTSVNRSKGGTPLPDMQEVVLKRSK